MEIEPKFETPWLDPSHPNYNRWKRSRELSLERGKFVKSIIEKFIKCEDLTILDLGSGEGGTSQVLADNNFVVSFDIDKVRLQRQNHLKNKSCIINGDAMKPPFKEASFDLIILQDVIEHVPDANEIIDHLKKLLKVEGRIYLSTPNKHSIFNIIADPHWGLPFLGLLSRKNLNKYFLKKFRKKDYNRKDAAQLLSLYEIRKMLNKDFSLRLNTKHSVEKLLEGNKGIVWSEFHLGLLKIIRKAKLDKVVMMLANDNFGFVNKLFNPTFYFILTKR